jgi:trimeric autotransporter adhesin
LVTGVLTTTATQVATGGITSGSDIISDTDSTDSLGSTGVRWLKGWFDTLTAGTLTVGSGSVTDSSGAISFGDENLTTTGIVTAAGTSVFTNLDISGDVDVDGTLETDNLTVGGAQGTDGQVLTSTGSGVAWEDASGGGGVTFKTFGTNSIMVGADATGTIDAANNNTGLGVDIFTALTTGDSNTAIGTFSLELLTTGSSNSAVGYKSLEAVTEGGYNTALGWVAGYQITTGTQNVCIGATSGDAITTGTDNVSVGYNALTSNTTANYNVAVGSDALLANTTGTQNTAVGRIALTALTTGASNAALGGNAGGANTTGNSNVFCGDSAGYGNTTGYSNTFVGQSAGAYTVLTTTGTDNTMVGAASHATAADAVNVNVFGRNVAGESGYTTIGLDGSDIRAAHGTATWSTVSDRRVKKDIEDSTAGLSFINALKPRTFKYKNLGELPETFRAYEAGSTEAYKNPKTQHGFIAQEVKEVIDAHDSIKDGFTFWDDRDDGSQEVAESALIPVLVKAIQELSAEVETLKSQIGE